MRQRPLNVIDLTSLARIKRAESGSIALTTPHPTPYTPPSRDLFNPSENCYMTPNLNRWYISKCNGEWEHKYGITITTCDNPGWLVTLRLADTDIQPGDRVLFQDGQFGEDGEPWVDIRVRGDSLAGACSPNRIDQLDELLGECLGLV